MKLLRPIAALALVAACTMGCTPNKILRATIGKSPTDVCDFAAQGDLAYFTQPDKQPCTRYSIEDHRDYTVGFVEFDDQGWL